MCYHYVSSLFCFLIDLWVAIQGVYMDDWCITLPPPSTSIVSRPDTSFTELLFKLVCKLSPNISPNILKRMNPNYNMWLL